LRSGCSGSSRLGCGGSSEVGVRQKKRQMERGGNAAGQARLTFVEGSLCTIP
jgi:hypothetical protein